MLERRTYGSATGLQRATPSYNRAMSARSMGCRELTPASPPVWLAQPSLLRHTLLSQI
jgi:hypothetical protein